MKKILITITVLFLVMLVGCTGGDNTPPDSGGDPNNGGDQEPAKPDYKGTYLLESYLISDIDITSQYVYGSLELESEKAKLTFLDLYGLDVQEGTYTQDDEKKEISVAIGLKKYVFKVNDKTLTYEGKVSRKENKMVFKKADSFNKPNTNGGVSFTDELFGQDINENFYNYCPTIMMEGNSTMHIWYCTNKVSGNVTDYVGYRKGTLLGDGTWQFTENAFVLEPTPDTFDSRHVCDPTVIKGEFSYKTEKYNYLMAYLGCVTSNNAYNEVGIAVAKNPEGPWIKIDEVNPIANYYESSDYDGVTWAWGYGQPSLVSVDKKGKALLFYTKGERLLSSECVEYWDFSNLDNPVKLNSVALSNTGVVNASGGTDVINNADFAYDPNLKRLYVIKEDWPTPNNGGVDWITGSNTAMYLELGDETYPGEKLFTSSSLKWNLLGSVKKSDTGFERNHNMGLVTDEYGWLINPFQLPIVYTMSNLKTDYPEWEAGGQWPALHTYRLHGHLIDIA